MNFEELESEANKLFDDDSEISADDIGIPW
jgi:hypothetical protein